MHTHRLWEGEIADLALLRRLDLARPGHGPLGLADLDLGRGLDGHGGEGRGDLGVLEHLLLRVGEVHLHQLLPVPLVGVEEHADGGGRDLHDGVDLLDRLDHGVDDLLGSQHLVGKVLRLAAAVVVWKKVKGGVLVRYLGI